MSEETNAVDGATPAAPVENAAPAQESQETPQTPANADAGEVAEQPRDEKGRFKPTAQERINDLTGKWRQTERERDALYAQIQQIQSQQPQNNAQADNPPAIEDYPDLNQWAAAVTKHARQQATADARREFSQQQQQSSQQQVLSSYEAKERDYAGKNPDYADAYASLQSTVRFHPAVLEVIATSDIGPEVVHHLGKHLDEADRIARSAPHLAAAEIARIEARLKAPKTKPVTKAPTPAPTLGGGSKPSGGIREDMSYAEYKAARMKG